VAGTGPDCNTNGALTGSTRPIFRPPPSGDNNLKPCLFRLRLIAVRRDCLSVRLLIHKSDQPASPGEAGASTETVRKQRRGKPRRTAAAKPLFIFQRAFKNQDNGTLPYGHHPARRCCGRDPGGRVSARIMRKTAGPERSVTRQFSILNSPLSISLGKYQSTRCSQLSTFGLTFQIFEMYEVCEETERLESAIAERIITTIRSFLIGFMSPMATNIKA
jgi:hypothetical protein